MIDFEFIFNIETGDFIKCDTMELMGRGMPQGYKCIDYISVIEYINKIREMKYLEKVTL